MEFQEIYDQDGPLSHEQLLHSGITLSALGYGTLSNALNCFFERVRANKDADPT